MSDRILILPLKAAAPTLPTEQAPDHPALHLGYPHGDVKAALSAAWNALPACNLLGVIGNAIQEIQALERGEHGPQVAPLPPIEAAPSAEGVKLAPIKATSHMLNSAVSAWHSWTSRDSGGSIQLLAALMWDHMIDASPKPGDWDFPAPGTGAQPVAVPGNSQAKE